MIQINYMQIKNCETVINQELAEVCDWLNANKLTYLNKSK